MKYDNNLIENVSISYDFSYKSVVNAIQEQDMWFFKQYLARDQQNLYLPFNLSIIDFAYIFQKPRIIQFLEEHGFKSNLDAQQLEKYRKFLPGSGVEKQTQIKIINNSEGFCIEISEKNLVNGDVLIFGCFSKEDLENVGMLHINVAIIKLAEKNCLAILSSDNLKKDPIILELSEHGSLKLLKASDVNNALDIETKNGVEFTNSVLFHSISIKARELIIPKETTIRASKLNLEIENTINHDGEILADKCLIRAQKLTFNGSAIFHRGFDIKLNGKLALNGNLVAGKFGKIHAHAINVQLESLIQVVDGELKAYGKAFIKNHGALLANHIMLNSQYLIHNYHGALIKGLTCIIPPSGCQFNNAGLYLVGRGHSLSMWDKFFTASSILNNVAGYFSLIPANVYKYVKIGLLLGKTVYRSAALIQKIQDEGLNEVLSSEYVSLFLDHILPSLGALTDSETQTQFLCSFLYQCWGSYYGEQDYIDRTIGVIEVIMRGVAAYSPIELQDSHIKILNKTATALKHSHTVLKFANAGVDLGYAFYNRDELAIQNAKDTLSALAESQLRNYLSLFEPVNLFGIELNPKDLVFFILNKGYSLPKEEIIRRIVYAGIYAFHKSGIINDNQKLDYQFAAQVLCSGYSWIKLCNEYQKNSLSLNKVCQQAFHDLTHLASYKYSKNAFNNTSHNNPLKTIRVPNDEQPTINDDYFQEPVEKIKYDFTINVERFVEQQLANNKQQLSMELDNISFTNIKNRLYNYGVTDDHLFILREFKHAFDGDYANSGYLGVFVNELHNHGVLDSVGGTSLVFSEADNSGVINASNHLLLQGRDSPYLKTSFDDATINSTFRNEEGGFIQTPGVLNAAGIDAFENSGIIQTDLFTVKENKFFYNRNNAAIISNTATNITSNIDVINDGFMHSSNVNLEGKDACIISDGILHASDTINLRSQNYIIEGGNARLSSQKVNFSAQNVLKEGNIQANLVKLQGRCAKNMDSVEWQEGQDNIGGLIFSTSERIKIDPKSLNNANMTHLPLGQSQVDNYGLPKIDPNFDKILQIEASESNNKFNVSQLPQFDEKGTLILVAPGSTLEANGEVPEYSNRLVYKGEHFKHRGDNNFHEAYFDTQDFHGETSEDRLILKDGGGIQTKEFQNNGTLKSEGSIFWNVDAFSNNAQAKSQVKTVYNNTKDFKKGNSTAVEFSEKIEGSGTVHAKHHMGIIKQFNQTGGSFTSDEGGNDIQTDNMNLHPLWTNELIQPLGHLEDWGTSWHSHPKSHNAQVGSKGINKFSGQGELNASGADIWGDQGISLSFDEGIVTTSEARPYHISAAGPHRRGKDRAPTITEAFKEEKSTNHIDSNEGFVNIVSTNSNIDLHRTNLSALNDVNLSAKYDINIKGDQSYSIEKENYKVKSFLNSTKVRSETRAIEVNSSYLFVGGNLRVSCLNFNLTSVSGLVQEMEVNALNMHVAGQECSSATKRSTTQFSIAFQDKKLTTLLNSHNAKAVFANIIKSCGWTKEKLLELLEKDILHLPEALLNDFSNTWNLTALVAKTCDEYKLGDPADFIGNITDRIGLTKIEEGSRTLNFNLKFNFSKITENIEYNNTVESDLMIGGTFTLTGNKLTIADGSKISANDLVISLVEGIEFLSGEEKLFYSNSRKGVTFNINPLDLKLIGGSIHNEKFSKEVIVPKLSELVAKNSASIQCGQFIEGEGKISAGSGQVNAPDMNFTTLQHIEKEKNKAQSFNFANSNSNNPFEIPFGINASSNRTENIETREKAGIYLPNGTVKANNIVLNNGSTIEARTLDRSDNNDGLPAVMGTVGYDKNTHKSKNFSLQVAGGESGFQFNKNDNVTTTIQRPTVVAENVSMESLSGINTDKENISEIIKNKESNAGFGGSSDSSKNLTWSYNNKNKKIDYKDTHNNEGQRQRSLHIEASTSSKRPYDGSL